MTMTPPSPTVDPTVPTDPTSHTTSRAWWVVVGSLMLAATVLWGALQVVGLIAREQSTEVVVVPEGITAIEFSVDHGSIRISTGPSDTTTLTKQISEGLWPSSHSEELVDGRLVVSASCSVLVSTWCSFDYDVEIPEGVSVVVRSGHGSVRVEGGTGDLDVRTEHGSVRVDGVGEIDVIARTSHGDVRIATAEPPSRVEARTGHGDVDVVLPESDQAYHVDARTDHGDVVNAIRSDPTSERVVIVRTGHGDATVRYGS